MANAKIKGITIEIGGDTTKLGKAIADSEKKSRSLQTELRSIEKLLKFDPTNVELLAQKQKVLSDMVGETSDKLNTLKEAEAQVTAQFESGEIGEDQYRAFQREIIQTEKDLNNMSKELDVATRNLNEFGDNNGVARSETEKLGKSADEAKADLQELGDKAKEAGDKVKTGLLAIGGATIAGAGYALKLSTDFDKAFNTLQTRTGASAEEMEGLNASMEAIYSNNFGESIEDVAVSMATVANNTKLSGAELETMTSNAILLRDTFEFDVNESTRSAKMLMDQFGLSGEEAYNLIAQGAQNGLDKNGDLLDTVNEYSVHFQQLGLDSEDMFNMLVNGAESGTFSVDKLGDAVKEFGIRAKDGSTTTIEGFQALGLNAEEMGAKFGQGGDVAKQALNETMTALFAMEDPIAQNTAGVNLFGTQWEDLGVEGVKALMEMDGAIATTSDSLDNINDQKYDDIGSALSGLGRTLQTDVVKPIGEELKPVVEDAIGYVKDNAPSIKDFVSNLVTNIGKFVGFIVDNGSTILSVITGIGAGFVAWNVATMISGVVTAIKAFKLANEGATVSQMILNTVMKANPVVLIVSLIATLVGALITFIATNDDARAKIAEVWEAIKETFSVVLDAIVGFFSSAWESIKNIWSAVVGFFEGIWTGIKNIYSVVTTWFTTLFQKAWTGIKNIWSAVTGFFLNIWTSIKNIFSVVSSWFTSMFSNAWNGIKNIWSAVGGFFSSIWSRISSTFSNVGGFFRDKFTSAVTAIKNVFSPLYSFFSGMWSKITGLFKSVGTTVGSAISGAVKSAVNGVLSGAINIINGFISALNGAIGIINKIPGVKIGKISKLSVPKLARGGVVNGATLAQIGEDGAEAVVPLENNTEWLNKIANKLNDIQTANYNSTDNLLLSKLNEISNRLANFSQDIVLDTGVLVGETINKIDDKLARNYSMKARGI